MDYLGVVGLSSLLLPGGFPVPSETDSRLILVGLLLLLLDVSDEEEARVVFVFEGVV